MGILRRKAVRALSWLLWPLLMLLLRLLLRTWRIRLVDDGNAIEGLPARGEPVIIAIWHSDLLPLGALLHRRLVVRGHTITALISRSADGEILVRAATGFGFRAIRGSTSSGGLSALRRLYREIRAGQSMVVAPDGPRGPAGVAQTGIVQIARLSETPIVPIAARARRAWRARSWDRTLVPKPFAEVVVVVGKELRCGKETDLERETARVEAALTALGETAEGLLAGS